MRSSPEEAKRIMRKWEQESSRLRFTTFGPPLGCVADGRIKSFDGDDLWELSGDSFVLQLELDGAEFEYTDAREGILLPKGCVCSLAVTIEGARRMVPEPFGTVRFLICELG